MKLKDKLPKGWHNVTVAQFLEINELQTEQFESILDYEIEVLSILLDEEDEYFLEMDFDELNEVIDQVTWLKQQPRNKLQKRIESFVFAHPDKLKLGEFIDLEFFFADGYVKNLTKICAIFWRKTKQDEWGNELREPYSFDLNERKDEFINLPITHVYEIIPIYLKWRENFLNVYNNLFEPIITEPDEDEELDAEDIKAEQEEKKFKRWSWEQTLYTLANEDITKIEDVTNLSAIFAFNMLSMKKDLAV